MNNLLKSTRSTMQVAAMALGIAAAAPLQAQVTVNVLPTSDWVWLAPQHPVIEMTVRDSLLHALSTDITLRITTDTHQPVSTMTQHVTVAQGDSANLCFDPGITQPGFYSAEVLADGKTAYHVGVQHNADVKPTARFTFGYEPEHITSLPDYPADFKAYWDEARAQLAAIDPQYKMTELTDKSSDSKKFYRVSMLSWGGDTIQAYLTIPTKKSKVRVSNKIAKGKYPVHILYMGYNSDVWDLSTADDGWIQLLLCVRGQALNKPTNRYGDWVQYGLDDAKGYYYRGAYMDCVRAIDFVCTLPEADQRNIFAEGGSQGGAFTMAAAALDDRLCAVAPYITFMSDFPDYFQIVHWPYEAIHKKQLELHMTDEAVLHTMSYVDIKNLARWINCPVMLGCGLQDPTCPPHTNFSGYNLVAAPKEYIIFRTRGHDVDYSIWSPRCIEWFKKWIR